MSAAFMLMLLVGYFLLLVGILLILWAYGTREVDYYG